MLRTSITEGAAGVAGVAALALAACAGAPESAGEIAGGPANESPFAGVPITPEALGDGLYMLSGPGGNIGVSIGDDGVFLIDDELAEVFDQVAEALDDLGAGEVRFVLNTHHHFDHSGGNAPLAEAGATVFAHDNARARMTTAQPLPFGDGEMPALPPEGWPIVSFSQDVTFHINGQTVHAFHTPPAHTDGDVMVYFEEADVLHTGDAFLTVGFPLIDFATGGALEGFVAAETMALARIDENTRIIPGHGPLGSYADLVRTRDALARFRDVLVPLAASDMRVDEIVASQPLAGLDEGFEGGYVDADAFVATAITQMRKDAAD